MCLKMPKVNTSSLQVTGSQLVPETQAKTPETAELGGTNDKNEKKGRKMLTIDRGYNPMNL